MEDHDCSLHMKKGLIQIHGMKIPLHKNGQSRCARVQLAEDVSIPAHSEVVVPGLVKARHWISGNSVGTVEPCESFIQKTGMLLARSVVNTDQAELPVMLANYTDEEIKICRGADIALLEPVNEITPLSKITHEMGDPEGRGTRAFIAFVRKYG